MSKSRFIVITNVFVLTLVATALATDSSVRATPRQEVKYGQYDIRIYEKSDSDQESLFTRGSSLEILEGTRRVWQQTGGAYFIGKMYSKDPDADLVTPGVDSVGDGQLDLVISEYSGGAHCCLTFHLFELEPKFRKIGPIDAKDGDVGPHFVQVAGTPGLAIQIKDWTFSCWKTEYARSRAPTVILVYSDDEYRVAPDLMRSEAPTIKDLEERATKVRKDSEQSGA
jgi:hypothetical protein